MKNPFPMLSVWRPSRRKLLFTLPALAVVGTGSCAALSLLNQNERAGPPRDDLKPPLPPLPPPPLAEQKIPVALGVAAVAMSPGGRHLAVAMNDDGKGGVLLFERHEHGFKELWQKWPEVECGGVAFSPSDPWLAVVNQSSSEVMVWDYAANEGVEFPNTQNLEGVRVLAFSPDGSRLVSGIRPDAADNKSMVRVWQTTGSRASQDFASPDKQPGRVRNVAFSSDGGYVMAADDGPQPGCLVWDVSGKHQWTALGIEGTRVSAAFARSAPVLAVANKNSVSCYSLPKFEPIGTEIIANDEPEMIAISPEGRFVAIKLENRVVVHDRFSGKPRHTFSAPGPAWALVFTPDGKNLISGHTGKVVRVWVVSEPSS